MFLINVCTIELHSSFFWWWHVGRVLHQRVNVCGRQPIGFVVPSAE